MAMVGYVGRGAAVDMARAGAAGRGVGGVRVWWFGVVGVVVVVVDGKRRRKRGFVVICPIHIRIGDEMVACIRT